MITVACNAPPGTGGLGRHFADLLDEFRWQGRLRRYYSTALDPEAPGEGEVVGPPRTTILHSLPPLRFSSSWRSFLSGDAFDRRVAARLVPAETHVGFPAQSRRSFLRARRLGSGSLQLVAATSHIDNVARRHAEARRRWPLEDDWLNEAHRRKVLKEYELADVILVSSSYSWQSFLAEGVPEQKLRLWEMRPDPRFQPPSRKPEDGVFRIVFIGAVSVVKGVPVLLEALQRLQHEVVELTLVGGCGSRAMRRHVEAAMARDPRIRLCPGDPLPHLRRADVLVHPSFQEGFGYAPMEALACDVPVIVSEDTGMKEHVEPGLNGWVVPTGSVDAIVDRLQAMMSARPSRSPGAGPSGRQLELAGGHDHGPSTDPGPRRRGVDVEGARPAHLDPLLDQE
ncbi:MAG: glycosyltransferase family 4 protein [Candidatus Dormibacteraeota bacterium]|nr:glycosyltransferase family 4 protein [Candidatus Dormibacteraeota bacterium]